MGFSIAAPVGPIGVLCIRRTISNGRLSVGLRAWGSHSRRNVRLCGRLRFDIHLQLPGQPAILAAVDRWCFFVLPRGENPAVAPAEQAASAGSTSVWGDYLSTFFLTVTNPMTILSFAAVFAGMGLASASGGYDTAGLLVLGVVIGSALWWLCLSESWASFGRSSIPAD